MVSDDGSTEGYRDALASVRAYAASKNAAAVFCVDGLRLITLDSLVPGKVHGQIPDDELAALTTLLRKPTTRGSVDVLHHPPVALDPSTRATGSTSLTPSPERRSPRSR